MILPSLRQVLLTLLLLAGLGLPGGPSQAEPLSQGQTLYVPVYSHVFSGDRGLPFNLAATLSLRNCDPEKPLRILAADYYDSAGKRLQRHLTEPLEIPPLASHSIFIKETDTSGGFGARSGQGISFISPARVIADTASR